jgi:hypothetical protein
VPRKGRARRFREARQLKQGFDDGMFKEDEKKSLADEWDEDGAASDDDELDDDEWDDEDDDEYDPLDH